VPKADAVMGGRFDELGLVPLAGAHLGRSLVPGPV
jgi:hypothetical protein